ncbi:MAG TPA: VanZ family protein [Albitalea sp.]|uniref:VanZ family protein n=1 Tax=Piscinibacter sp. TaxID=1903157 RepID=UPI002ED0502A
MPGHRSSAAPLAGLYAALVVYASLYPFSGWRQPGVSVFAFLSQPWWHWWTAFDLVSNLVGYLPLGALLFGTGVRSGWSVGRSLAFALGAGAGLSFTMELLQNFLPQRRSTNVDLALNVMGTALGALLGWGLHVLGAVGRWQAVRDRWFIDRSAGGLALLVLWPFGLLFPGPVPFAGGQMWPRLRDTLSDWLQDSAVASWFEPWLQPDDSVSSLSSGSEFMAIALGVLAPCLLAFVVSRPGWRRVVLALGAALAGLAAITLSTALNFGPQHSLAWRTPPADAALVTGVVLALLLAWVPRRAAAGLGLIALAALVTVIAQAPADAYFAESLQGWEQGRFIRFHGAAQWVGWLWPYAAMAYLLVRIAARDSG